MPKLKLTLFLPLCQLGLAIGLLAWGHRVQGPYRLDTLYVPTPTLVCIGVNAPALVAWPVISLLTATPMDHPHRAAFSFGLDEIIFVATAVLLWYLAARWFALIRRPKEDRIVSMTTGTVARHLLVMALGTVLFLHALSSLLSPGKLNNPVGSRVEGTLSLVWAATFLIIPLKSLFRAVQASNTHQRH